jgi:hypothetical protein
MMVMWLWMDEALRDSSIFLVLLLQGTRDSWALASKMSHGGRGTCLGDGNGLVVVDSSFGIEALGNDNFGQLRIRRGSVSKTLGTDVVGCVVRDEVELLVVCGSDTERLLQEAIVAVGVFSVIAALGLIELAVG